MVTLPRARGPGHPRPQNAAENAPPVPRMRPRCVKLTVSQKRALRRALTMTGHLLLEEEEEDKNGARLPAFPPGTKNC